MRKSREPSPECQEYFQPLNHDEMEALYLRAKSNNVLQFLQKFLRRF